MQRNSSERTPGEYRLRRKGNCKDVYQFFEVTIGGEIKITKVKSRLRKNGVMISLAGKKDTCSTMF